MISVSLLSVRIFHAGYLSPTVILAPASWKAAFTVLVMFSRLLITLLRCEATMSIELSVVITLATLLEVSTIHAIASSWQVVNGPLSTACKAMMNFSAIVFSMTGDDSADSILKTISFSVTWNSSSTSDAKMFQSIRTCSFTSFLIANTT